MAEVEALVQDAIKWWTPRFVQQGIDMNDYHRTVANIKNWEGWLDPWVELGDKHLERAKEAEKRGRLITAGYAYASASLAYHFGKYLWVLDLERYASVTHKSVACLGAAYRHLDKTWERIEAPLDAGAVVGNLRRPPGVNAPPLMLLVPGLDSTKEEFFTLERMFLDRGIATLSMDGAGQGEAGLKIPITAEFERSVAAILDKLAGRRDLNLDRIGIIGVSSGGFYASRAAAFEPRIKAVAVCGCVFNYREGFDQWPLMIRQKLVQGTHSPDEATAKKRIQDIDTLSIAHLIKQPYMIIHGTHDWAFPLEKVKPVAAAAPNCDFQVIPDGNHAIGNYPYIWQPLITDWMREKLA